MAAFTWTPKVCKVMAFMAIIRGLGLLFYILLGFRYSISIIVDLAELRQGKAKSLNIL